MAENKTQANDASVADFLDAIPNAQIREDSRTIVRIMQAATNARPRMWGTGIIGFGECRITHSDGRESDWMLIGFAPRRQRLTLYIMDGFKRYDELLSRLGKHSHGKACLHVRRLTDVDVPTLTKLIRESVRHRIATSAPHHTRRSSRAETPTRR